MGATAPLPGKGQAEALRTVVVPSGLRFSGTPSLGMLFVHPHLDLAESEQFGFSLTNPCKQKLEKTIRECLSIAASNPGEGGVRTHFVVLPEFSLPFSMFSGVEEILRHENWPPNTGLISGVENTSVGELQRLLEGSDNPEEAKRCQPGLARFANFGVIWLKNSEGRLCRFVQPKLRPSRPEQAAQGMYEGDFVLLFQTDTLSFMCLICFDCIARDPCGSVATTILKELGKNVVEGYSINVDLVFVPQHNPNADHPEFLQFAEAFLYAGGTSVRTGDGGIVFVNSASEAFGRSRSGYGRSALYYRQGRWQPSGPDGPLLNVPRTFALEKVRSLVGARFREDGPCVHRFAYSLPSVTGATAGDPRYPLAGACCHKISSDGAVGSGEQIHALAKVVLDWITPELDKSDPRLGCTSPALKSRVSEVYSEVRRQLTELSDADIERLGQMVDLLFLDYEKPNRRPAINPDHWQSDAVRWHEDPHGQALIEFGSVVVVLGMLEAPSLRVPARSHTGRLGDLCFTIVDGYDLRTSEDLKRAYFEFVRSSSWEEMVGKTNLLVLTRVQRGSPRNEVAEEIPNYLELQDRDYEELPESARPNREDIATTTTKGYWHVSSKLREALDSDTVEDAKNFLRGKLGSLVAA
jgi:hypothetical protein